mmetsp:Transcript_25824/g.54128  ORF Transcript_25824/g.54128 Transcript_25824/m.54128 type:complete len:245 (+) Transcript_25824:552-1286(+)
MENAVARSSWKRAVAGEFLKLGSNGRREGREITDERSEQSRVQEITWTSKIETIERTEVKRSMGSGGEGDSSARAATRVNTCLALAHAPRPGCSCSKMKDARRCCTSNLMPGTAPPRANDSGAVGTSAWPRARTPVRTRPRPQARTPRGARARAHTHEKTTRARTLARAHAQTALRVCALASSFSSPSAMASAGACADWCPAVPSFLVEEPSRLSEACALSIALLVTARLPALPELAAAGGPSC